MWSGAHGVDDPYVPLGRPLLGELTGDRFDKDFPILCGGRIAMCLEALCMRESFGSDLVMGMFGIVWDMWFGQCDWAVLRVHCGI